MAISVSRLAPGGSFGAARARAATLWHQFSAAGCIFSMRFSVSDIFRDGGVRRVSNPKENKDVSNTRLDGLLMFWAGSGRRMAARCAAKKEDREAVMPSRRTLVSWAGAALLAASLWPPAAAQDKQAAKPTQKGTLVFAVDSLAAQTLDPILEARPGN